MRLGQAERNGGSVGSLGIMVTHAPGQSDWFLLALSGLPGRHHPPPWLQTSLCQGH